MGDRFARRAARQHPDLTHPRSDWRAPSSWRFSRSTVCLSAVAGAFFLPLYIGSMPFPISALISGLVNAALVWAALQWTSAPRVAALPLWAWLLTVAVPDTRRAGRRHRVRRGRSDGVRAAAASSSWARCRRPWCCGATCDRAELLTRRLPCCPALAPCSCVPLVGLLCARAVVGRCRRRRRASSALRARPVSRLRGDVLPVLDGFVGVPSVPSRAALRSRRSRASVDVESSVVVAGASSASVSVSSAGFASTSLVGLRGRGSAALGSAVSRCSASTVIWTASAARRSTTVRPRSSLAVECIRDMGELVAACFARPWSSVSGPTAGARRTRQPTAPRVMVSVAATAEAAGSAAAAATEK